MNNRKIDICIVSHMAYGALKGGETGHAGGVEFQTSLLAKWLAKRSHKVSFITWDEGGPKEEIIDGVRVIKLCRADEGIPGLRFFHPRWTSLIRALKRADADIYYHNLGEYITGQIAFWAKVKQKKFIYYIASDDECMRFPLRRGRLYDRLFFIFGIKTADRVLAQTYTQQEMLKNNFNLDADVVPMPCSLSIPLDSVYPLSKRKPEILWIGRISKEKRPDVLLKLAEELPRYLFHVIGKPGDGDLYGSAIIEKFLQTSNIKYYGLVPHGRLPEFYNLVKVFLNTSEYEGFPNTFLEAWGFGLPVISTFDPDKIIGDKGLGYHVKTVDKLGTAITSIMNSEQQWLALSKNCHEYYLKNHLPEIALKRFEDLFLTVIDR